MLWILEVGVYGGWTKAPVQWSCSDTLESMISLPRLSHKERVAVVTGGILDPLG